MAKSFVGLCLLLLLCLALTQSRRVSDHTYTLQLSSLTPSSSCTPFSKVPKSKSSMMNVVHKHGPCSHLGQHGSEGEIMREILRQDMRRVESIRSRFSGFEEEATLPARSGRELGSGNYYVKVGLGTPKKELSLLFDTGSDLTWTQCQPCAGHCYSQEEPIFDPSASTSYANQTCSSQTCSLLKSPSVCSESNPASTCIYTIKYGDGSVTQGYLATETLSLTSSEVIQNFIFGCGQNNGGLFNGAAGLLGLGRDPTSILQQSAAKYGQQFSYCLPSSSSAAGHLTLGPSTSANSKIQTPMLTLENRPNFYALTIEAVTVANKAVPTEGLRSAPTIIDSGTVITRLPTKAYRAVSDEFKKYMTQYTPVAGEEPLDTCFDVGTAANGEFSIPKMSIVYGGGATVDLMSENIITQTGKSTVCLAFAGGGDDIAIVGNKQQVGFDVVYDVAGAKIGFTPNAC